MALLTVTHYPVRVPEGSAPWVPIRFPAGAPPELRKDCDGRHGHYQMNDS